MSRIGRKPVNIPEGVGVKLADGVLEVKGPKGMLTIKIGSGIVLDIADNQIRVKSDDNKMAGLTRTLVANAIEGVTVGFKKTLELSGTGYRATASGNSLQLALGFSHPVTITGPEDMSFEVKENKIIVYGKDREMVGRIAAKIRALRPADPYKIKGFKYENEVIIKKAGKAAKAGAVGAAK